MTNQVSYHHLLAWVPASSACLPENLIRTSNWRTRPPPTFGSRALLSPEVSSNEIPTCELNLPPWPLMEPYLILFSSFFQACRMVRNTLSGTGRAQNCLECGSGRSSNLRDFGHWCSRGRGLEQQGVAAVALWDTYAQNNNYVRTAETVEVKT